MKKRILTVVGARPQFIKAGTVSRIIKKSLKLEEYIIHTGQHYDENMSDVFFKEMNIPKPDCNLNINSSSHGEMTGLMVVELERVLLEIKPHCVLLYGDTNSTLAGAIAASKLNIPIAHVEAGLRSFNIQMPEEINRILTDRVSAFLFCPTLTAIKNLKFEGSDSWGQEVLNVGDVMYDGSLYYKEKAQPPVGFDNELGFSLVTIHRAENTNSKEHLKAIVNALNLLSNSMDLIMPLHPRTKIKLLEFKLVLSPRIRIIEPVGYLNMVWLILKSSLIITDSGGLQKEAYFFEKPCITFRKETEWVELVESGANLLVDPALENVEEICNKHKMFCDFSNKFYGNGDAADLIVNVLEKNL